MISFSDIKAAWKYISEMLSAKKDNERCQKENKRLRARIRKMEKSIK